MRVQIQNAIQESIDVKQKALQDPLLLQALEQSVTLIVNTYKAKGKVLFCGNGGSAADAQHLAAELSGRFYYDRPPLYAEALHVNSSFVTAVANDYGYDEVFARMTRAMGEKGDILVALSTSGNSPSVLKAIEAAKAEGMHIIGLTGQSGGSMKNLCDILMAAPTRITPRIQELHITLGHILCEQIEQMLFPQKD